VNERLRDVETVPELLIDAELHPEDLSSALVHAMSELAPFGEGNPEPIFRLTSLEIVQARTVGKDGKHWKLGLRHAARAEALDAVGWSLVTPHPNLGPGDALSIVCQLEENFWNGRTTLQLKLLDIRKQ
jgi:single-stranded-DNA-specific exonuclease